jgi:SAM-dependent methyltransferase
MRNNMAYEKRLRKIFHGTNLTLEDLYLLETFQINYLPDRLPEKEFAAILFSHPSIKSFLIKKHPQIAEFINTIQKKHGPASDKNTIDEYIDRVIWEIADLLIYNKDPGLYDDKASLTLNYRDITSVTSPKEKTVIDVGAGTGKVAFRIVYDAKTVFAVEPCSSLRTYMRKKATEKKITNLFIIDGYLHEIPLPKDFADILITSNAIGWNLEDEIKEIERVVKTGGHVIHLTSSPDTDDPLKQKLTKPELLYNFSEYLCNGITIRKYWKQIVA